ncbi:hypothetical protein V6N12_044364 [Hibiscus sabdariffa]|uniref:Uncharacterized protein n=1 Tax=Hibiscus sabdariffa TaxID=183260 RepID=A0ABR2DH14_9ROSI
MAALSQVSSLVHAPNSSLSRLCHLEDEIWSQFLGDKELISVMNDTSFCLPPAKEGKREANSSPNPTYSVLLEHNLFRVKLKGEFRKIGELTCCPRLKMGSLTCHDENGFLNRTAAVGFLGFVGSG